MGRLLLTSVVLATALLSAGTPAFAFSGEDLTDGAPWHHQDITLRALAGDKPHYEGADFDGGAAAAIAWHADFVDSYAYNPLWWFRGEDTRLNAVLVGRPELAKLHFDDVFSTSGILRTWERYAGGTLAGLYWASLQGATGDVVSGQNVLGVSLHAVQDFYSHSNWIDQTDRRCQTFTQTTPEVRAGMTIYTGAYGLASAGGPADHGAFSVSCSLLRGRALDTGLEPLCSGLSPLQNLPMCETFRMCAGAASIPFSIEDRQNNTLLYLEPPGIALDSTWMARVQAKNRGLLDDEGNFLPGLDGHHFRQPQCQIILRAERGEVCSANADMLFAGTKDLAIRASMEWVAYIEAAMNAMGPRQAAFWSRIKSEGSGSNEAALTPGFEDLSRLPYLFLSAGPQAQGNAVVAERPGEAAEAGDWYLRLELATDTAIGSGTDADIYAQIWTGDTGRPYLLDRLKTKGPLTGYDDFEEGDRDAYVIGPFAARPDAIELYNDDGGFGDIAAGAWGEFTQSVDSLLTSTRQLLISVIAGNADYVGTARAHLTFGQVETFLAGATFHEGSLVVDGGEQGKFRLDYRLRPTPATLNADEIRQGWQSFEVQVRRIQSLAESTVDRLSTADEPFILFMASPLNGRADPVAAYLSNPIADFDKDEIHVFPRRTNSASIIEIPPAGGVVLSLRIFESDDETQRDRETLRRMFQSGLKEAELVADARFIGEIGRVLAPAWTVAELDVFAFQRGAVPMAGPVLRRTDLGTIEGGATSARLPLDWSGVRALTGQAAGIGQWQAEPLNAKVLDGPWHASGYDDCSVAVANQRIDIVVEDDALTATKTLGDPCQPEGAITWTGQFADGMVTATVLPGKEPDTADAEGPAEDMAETRPDPRDPAIDPNLPLEGNWLVDWGGDSGSPRGLVVLSKGAEWRCVDTGGGCWYQWDRPADAGWSLELWNGPGLQRSAQSVQATGAGTFAIEYPYEHLGYWGGQSTITLTGEGGGGAWSYNERTGPERWTRAVPAIASWAWIDGERRVEAGPGSPPLQIQAPYVGPVYSMRGNRPEFVIDVMGENLWGWQDLWLPRSSDLEVQPKSYICADGDLHTWYRFCLNQGGVVGLRVSVAVWPDARPGRHVLYVNDQAVPFDLELTGYPAPPEPPGPREALLELRSCNVLAERDAPEGVTPLIFTRSAPLP